MAAKILLQRWKLLTIGQRRISSHAISGSLLVTYFYGM
jgi:hypothetical protein